MASGVFFILYCIMEKVFQKEICNIFVNFILPFQMSRL